MHFHMPKPLHGWREFFGEIGIIVVGVLIALSAEQLLETLHWREKVDQANEQLKLELHGDARSAYEFLAIRECLQGQLNEVERAARSARDTGEMPPVSAYSPPLVQFTSDAWLNARALQVADHIGPKAMREYSLIYFFPRELENNIVQLRQFSAELRPLVGGLHKVSPEEAGTYQRLISKTRELQERTALAGALLLKEGGSIGVNLSQSEMHKSTQNARNYYGACVAPAKLDSIISSVQ